MKRFQITEAEYEAIKAKEGATKDKKISRRLQVLMLRYEGKKLGEISEILKRSRDWKNSYETSTNRITDC